jgi:(S)-mandelate dehydrogenase
LRPWQLVRDLNIKNTWAPCSGRDWEKTLALMNYGSASGAKWATVSDFVRAQINPSTTWDDLKWVRDKWDGRLIVKGLADVRQVPSALAAGYEGIVVSNHGGRQLDGAISTIDVLQEFVEAAGGKIPVLIDSGFRSGTDVLRALALGATAVQLGRSTLYGLSVAGEAGVDRALSIIQLKLDIAMALTGITRPQQAHANLLRRVD